MDSLDSGLSIAELKFELPVVTMTAFAHYRGIEEHVENDNHEIYGTQETRGDEDYKLKPKQNHCYGTLLKYKKGLKRPTLAWNEMSFVTMADLNILKPASMTLTFTQGHRFARNLELAVIPNIHGG